jgi:hypothetical protein
VDPLSGADAVRDALEGIEAAVQAAAKRRVQIVRELATVTPPDALAADHRTLVEALLRREAADADTTGSPQERAAAVLAEARRAHDARERLAHAAADDAERAYLHTVDLLRVELDATWRWTLDRADAFAAGLVGRTTTDVSDAVAGYVAAFRGVLQASETLDAAAVDRAVARAEDATAALERALSGEGPTPGRRA